MLLPVLAVLSQMHYEADIPPTGGDYVDVPFVVPAGTVEIEIAHSDGSSFVILDWGVWAPEGFRGWAGGLEENVIIGVNASSRSYLPGPITPGTWTVSIGKAKIEPTGAHYSIDVTCRDNQTLTPALRGQYVPIVLSSERRWYKGDFHVHSEQSGDATATFAQIATLARSRGLDFVNLSDHNTNAQHALVAAVQPSLSDFLFLRGAEITTYAGHGNSVGAAVYVDHRIGFQGRTVDAILREVEGQGAIFIVNHPALDLGMACIGCAWRHADTDWSKVAGIEVLTSRWDVTERLFTPGAIAMWDAALDEGHRIAAIGGSDDHRAGTGTGVTDSAVGSPTTLVYADNLSEAAIIDGIRAGRTIVQMRGPDDPMVDFTIDDAMIGDTAGELEVAPLRVHIAGGAGMFAQIWRDGVKLAQLDVTSDDFTGTYTDESAGDHRYRIELIDEGNQRIVVTSHIYASLSGASGCCSGGVASSLFPGGLVALVLLRRRGRGRRS